MSFGKKEAPPKTLQSSSTFKPSADQLALMKPAVNAGLAYAAAPPKIGTTVQGFDPRQTAGFNMMLGQTAPMGSFLGEAQGANQFLLGDVLRPESNPALQATIDAATRPISENFLQSIMPGIRDDFVLNNSYGSSKQGIASGMAANEAIRTAGDISSRIASEGYRSGLGAMVQGLQQAPTTAAAQLLPGMTQANIGQNYQNLAERMAQEQQFVDMFNQMAPWLAAKEVAGFGAAMPGGTATSTTPNPAYLNYQYTQASQPSMFESLLGLGATGLSFVPGIGQTIGGANAIKNIFG